MARHKTFCRICEAQCGLTATTDGARVMQIEPNNDHLVSSGYALVAFAGGFAGMMLSPIHLCLALTRTYFEAHWGGIYQRLLPAVVLTTLAVAIVFLVK